MWVHSPLFYTSGSAFAQGYGYHRASEAVEIALINAGISLTESIGGVGDTAIEAAVKAICELIHPGCPVGVIACYG